jgi:AcrR family transcriptional regulator
MLDRGGPEELTFRAVARELGITVGALSRYFPNLGDLEDEVAARILLELRPLPGAGKIPLLEQLVGMGMNIFEMHQTHPYLLTIRGPATAVVAARQMKHFLNVMANFGVEFDLAMAIYSLIGNLPYAWAGQGSKQNDPKLQTQMFQAFSRELGELAPQFDQLLASSSTASIYQRWLQLYIDGLLPAKRSSTSPKSGKSQ